MQNELDISFDALVAARQQLQNFCSVHYRSVEAYRDQISFRLYSNETPLGPNARHLSSSATCFESLFEIPAQFLPEAALPKKDNPEHQDIWKIATKFSQSAMDREQKDWLSDDSAHIYCRCRTLPVVFHHLTDYDPKIEGHLETILIQLDKDQKRFAIGEAFWNPEHTDINNWYPPNAFHTYWTLNILEVFAIKFPEPYKAFCKKHAGSRLDVPRLKSEMQLWARQVVGQQIGLHSADSPTLDSDQLAWSLAIITRFGLDFEGNLAEQDFIRCALKCLFDQQTKSGSWRTGGPLFHYLKSGNAYCYVFETFAVLLKSALIERKESTFLRNVLKTYFPHLSRLFAYAVSTQIPSHKEDGSVGWNSGHRVRRDYSESWATATVFSFAQSLRRLVGIWCRESAARQLNVSSIHDSPEAAIELLGNRGDSWIHKRSSVATQLMTLFVNPVRRFQQTHILEPDYFVIEEQQARAAILFGPPGTSKTTLSRSIADAIGWDYVELHASHFVAEGLPDVQRTADRIFEKLMQLDRTVILFDEIDELVREREGEEGETDAFGRFLTTSMLPKLAELWKNRKVIYFVATNYIKYFDSAITRAQRFDALVYVAPPSFERKIKQLTKLLRQRGKLANIRVTERDIKEAFRVAAGTNSPNEVLPASESLARFMLMRWDQLDELAYLIGSDFRGKTEVEVTSSAFATALEKLSDRSLKKRKPFLDAAESIDFERHDFSKVGVWLVDEGFPERLKDTLVMSNNKSWYETFGDFGDLEDFPCKFTAPQPGVISCVAEPPVNMPERTE